MSGFLTALAFLTRVPIPRAAQTRIGDLARAAPWLPVVGALIGAAVALVVVAGAMVGPWVAALLGLLAWIWITGGLHVDGLADVADALGAAHGNAERFVEVARDPHLGSFGAMAIGLQLLAKLVLLAALAEAATSAEMLAGLALVAAWARWSALFVGRTVRPLTEGLGSKFCAGIEPHTVALQGAVLAIASFALAPPLLVALPLAALLIVYWKSRLGGITGDCLGAGIEATESLLLFALLFA